MDDVFVSFITPVYNTKKYIDECIASVINQTYNSWELILIDDGSTDGSGEICDKYASADKRIKVIHKNNSGQYDSRKQGIAIAQGKYCTGIDSDDYIDKRYVEIIKTIVEDRNVDILEWGISNSKEFLRNDKSEGKQYQPSDYLKKIVEESDNSFCNKLFKRNLMNDLVDIPNGLHHYEDLMMIVPAISKAKNIYVITDRLYFYRENENSVSHRVYVEDTINFMESYAFANEILKKYCSEDCLIDAFREKHARILYDNIKMLFKNREISKKEADIIRNHPLFIDLDSNNKNIKNVGKDDFFQLLFKFRMYSVINLYCKIIVKTGIDCNLLK